MALDIGQFLFVELLKMHEYPGSPFSGNIVNDLVMFLFIPTVFIIVIIYTLVGRLTDNKKIDLMLSIAFYLFIIFGGYYRMFAYLAGPYFLFTLIFLGIIVFFLGHFGRKGSHGDKSGGGLKGMPSRALSSVFGTSTTESELIHEYEMLIEMVSQGETELTRLEKESKANPGTLDRALAIQREAVNNAKRDLRKLELEMKKRMPGYKWDTIAKDARKRFGIK